MFPSGISGDPEAGTRITMAARDKAPASKGRVLVVDDEAEIRESLEALLDLEGYQVDLAQNAAEGERRDREEIGERRQVRPARVLEQHQPGVQWILSLNAPSNPAAKPTAARTSRTPSGARWTSTGSRRT